MSVSGAHFATPGQRAALFEGFLRDLDGVPEAERHQRVKQALESAFLAGASLTRSDPTFDPLNRDASQPSTLAFDDLPHDAQDGFVLACEIVGLGYPGSHPLREPEPLVFRPFHTSEGKRSWWAELPAEAREARWTPWVIATLERLGLVTELPNSSGRYTLTHRAVVLMQTGKASAEVPATPAWEQNVKAKGLAMSDIKQPSLV
jgi:hypothetical protein